jgi:hypothetical protein
MPTYKWSATPNCDICSATGTASDVMSGYSVCDGTAEFDAWTMDANFAKSFTASDPLVVGAGADAGFVLIEVGAVNVPNLDYSQGVVSAGHFQSGHDLGQNGCKDIATGNTAVLTPQANGLFGSTYCEQNSGADNLSVAYRVRAGLTYNNFNNSPWTFSPSLGFNHDLEGNAPSSLGGWVEDKMSSSVSAGFTNNNMKVDLSYSAQFGDAKVNSSTDKDYVSASLSYAF